MYILILFAFIAGIITVLSPCILPLLPIVLTGATVGSKKYPFGVVTGFVLSFTIFTLFLTTIVSVTGISADFMRYLAVFIIFVFGLVLIVPKFTLYFELLVSKLQSKLQKKSSDENIEGGKSEKKKTGFLGGLIVGGSLGLVWTPCVGPILASVIALALSGAVTGFAFLITLAYAVGTAIPMFIVMYGGKQIFQRVPWLLKNLGNIQKVFGVFLLIVGVLILFNLDRRLQVYILEKFPSYGTGLVQIEENEQVYDALDELFNIETGQDSIGKPMGDMARDMYKTAPEIISGGEWLNSEPLTLQGLKGKVVLIDFWTYSCINCIRTLPYIQSWHEEYKDSGLVVIGVHTPEFEFEKDLGNLEDAVRDFGLTYPIVQDNDYKTWRAYNNRYWPAKYFIDAQGRVRDMHFGEGDYDESENTIRELLAEAGYEIEGAGVELGGYDIYSRTPELYLGYGRIKNFASPEAIVRDKKHIYSSPEELNEDEFAYDGEWTLYDEYAVPGKGSGLKLNFESKNVFLVMNPSEGEPAVVEVYLDGKLIDDYTGGDVVNGSLTVDIDRLYTLVELDQPGKHLMELKFINGNVELYAFTFG